jgi:hypothetical protein
LCYNNSILTKDDLKLFDELIKKNLETGHVHTSKMVNTAVKASEERLRSEILAARPEAKADSLRIPGKLDKQGARIDLEKATGTPNPYKN